MLSITSYPIKVTFSIELKLHHVLFNYRSPIIPRSPLIITKTNFSHFCAEASTCLLFSCLTHFYSLNSLILSPVKTTHMLSPDILIFNAISLNMIMHQFRHLYFCNFHFLNIRYTFITNMKGEARQHTELSINYPLQFMPFITSISIKVMFSNELKLRHVLSNGFFPFDLPQALLKIT